LLAVVELLCAVLRFELVDRCDVFLVRIGLADALVGELLPLVELGLALCSLSARV